MSINEILYRYESHSSDTRAPLCCRKLLKNVRFKNTSVYTSVCTRQDYLFWSYRKAVTKDKHSALKNITKHSKYKRISVSNYDSQTPMWTPRWDRSWQDWAGLCSWELSVLDFIFIVLGRVKNVWFRPFTHSVVTVVYGNHYSDAIMSTVAFQITGVSIVCSAVCSGADQREHQSSASLAFVRGIPSGFLSQRDSNAENVSLWWRHHEWNFVEGGVGCGCCG